MAGEIRRRKVASAISRFLSTFLVSEYGDTPVAMIQINNVEMTVDLRFARIYYHTFNGEEKDEIQTLLDKSKKNIRFKLANHLKTLKFAPDIVFIFDDSVEKSMRIEKIFDEIKNEKKPGDENA